MRKIYLFLFLFVFLSCLNIIPASAQANDSLTISITPPLIKNNISPGQLWRSAIKLVNNNDQELSIYIQTLDFNSGPEDGTVNFITEKQDPDSDVYASNWLDITREEIIIPAQESKEVQFIVKVPENADPGGHYVAILAGTKPPDDKISGTGIKISSLLASLLLLNVSGEVSEQGIIREFSTDKNVYSDPSVKMTVRFENQGNIHLQPQGQILVYNWQNELQETISINHQSDYGHVLPKSIRRWEFDYQADKGLLDMGRYRAELVLGFGEQLRQTVDQSTYFWVLNIRAISILIGSILFLVIFIILLIKLYIRRAIAVTQKEAGLVIPKQGGVNKNITVIPEDKTTVDLKTVVKQKTQLKPIEEKISPSYRAIKWLIVFVIFVLLTGTAGFVYFINKDSKSEKQQVKEFVPPAPVEKEIEEKADEEEPDTSTSTSEEEIGIEGDIEEEEIVEINKDVIIRILNGSGISGQAARAAGVLEDNEYSVASTGNADSFNYNQTIVYYKESSLNAAEDIANTLEADLAEASESQAEDLVIVVGSDFK